MKKVFKFLLNFILHKPTYYTQLNSHKATYYAQFTSKINHIIRHTIHSHKKGLHFKAHGGWMAGKNSYAGCFSGTVRFKKMILCKDIVLGSRCATSWYDLDFHV